MALENGLDRVLHDRLIVDHQHRRPPRAPTGVDLAFHRGHLSAPLYTLTQPLLGISAFPNGWPTRTPRRKLSVLEESGRRNIERLCHGNENERSWVRAS